MSTASPSRPAGRPSAKSTPQRAKPAPQTGSNRPFDDTVPRLRAQLQPTARDAVLEEAASGPSWNDRFASLAQRVASSLLQRPHVSDEDRQMFQYVGMWVIGVVFALCVHGLWWLVSG